jgi:hypothetical protein
MYSKSQFHALEVMCRERAVVARRKWNTGLPKPKNGRGSAITETIL